MFNRIYKFFSYVESRAICRYLETKYKGKGTELIPTKDVKALGLFEQAASTEISYFDPYASGIVSERAFKK
jgi:glutathione S-transferase